MLRVRVVRERLRHQIRRALAVQLADTYPIRQGVDAVRRVADGVGNRDFNLPRIAQRVPLADGYNAAAQLHPMFRVHHIHQLAGHILVPRHACQPEKVYCAGLVGDIRVLVAFQHHLRPRFQLSRVFQPRVREYAAFDTPDAGSVGIQIGNPAVYFADGQLVDTLAVSKRIQPRYQCAGVHRLFDAFQLPFVVDAASGFLVGAPQVYRPRRVRRSIAPAGVKVPCVFLGQYASQRKQRRQKRRVFPLVGKLSVKVARAQLPALHGLPCQNVLHDRTGVDVIAADFVIAEENIIQQRRHHMLHVVGDSACLRGHFPAGNANDAVNAQVAAAIR